MATNVATLTAKLTADTRDFSRKMSRARGELDKTVGSTESATKAQKGLRGEIAGLGTTAQLVFAGAAAGAIYKFAKDSIRAASDLNESINAVQKTFGPYSEGVLAIGENSAKSFGMSQRAFNEFSTRFSAFAKNIAEEGGQNVVDVVGEMTGRIADFASVHNLSMEEAAQVASSTLAGETEAFRRFGGDVSAAAVEQKALQMGLIKTGDALTEQQKQLARYALFMEQTSNTAGDFKDTQGDLANATRTLTAQFEDFKAMLGSVATGPLAEIVGVGGDLLTIFGKLGDVVGGGGGLATLGNIAFDSLPFLSQLADALGWVAGLLDKDVPESSKATAAQMSKTADAVLALKDPVDQVRYAFEQVDSTQQRMTFEHIISELNAVGDAGFFGANGVYALNSALSGTEFGKFKQVTERTGGGGPMGFTAQERADYERYKSQLPSQGHQGGGYVMPGRPYMVGEGGAELFVPTQSGSVVPANSISLTQNFQRVDGNNIESDIARGLILSGIGRYIETGF